MVQQTITYEQEGHCRPVTKFDDAKVRKALVEQSYDREAIRYANRSDMQSGNLHRLLDIASRFSRAQNKNPKILDAGCGLGVAVPELQQRDQFPFSSYTGVDLSSSMIDIARQRHSGKDIQFLVGDLEDLDLPEDEFDLVLSNSVLHWLNQPASGLTIHNALSELHRVLVQTGQLAISVAGIGTGRRFNKTYLQVMDENGYRKDSCEPAGFVNDPIGCMQLHDVVDVVSQTGFDILFAHLEYEPLQFETAAHYADTVRAYGFDMFMAPVPEPLREQNWDAVCQRFAKLVGDGSYRHDQYMIYLIAEKL